MSDPLDDYQQDSSLQHIERRARETENNIADLALDVEFSRHMAELHQHPAWIALIGTLRDIMEAETNALLSGRMDQYSLGRRQGRIKTMRTLTAAKPLSEQELAERISHINTLRGQLADDRMLLSR